mmetsp:Transcript_42841/g.79863  ORF Transcript_42841/g.79863 Transcript_42841/m.79863 type:complete len:207 (+) Transcript_42841:433-1053(+)
MPLARMRAVPTAGYEPNAVHQGTALPMNDQEPFSKSMADRSAAMHARASLKIVNSIFVIAPPKQFPGSKSPATPARSVDTQSAPMKGARRFKNRGQNGASSAFTELAATIKFPDTLIANARTSSTPGRSPLITTAKSKTHRSSVAPSSTCVELSTSDRATFVMAYFKPKAIPGGPTYLSLKSTCGPSSHDFTLSPLQRISQAQRVR